MRAEQPELLEEITERIRSVLAAYGIHQAALYGSVVQGDANASSDVDLLVELPEEKTLLDLVALKRGLEAVLDRQVDVAEFGTLHPLIQEQVDTEKVPVA